MAQRIRHLTTNQGIAGSNPARVKIFLCQISISRESCDKKYAPPGGLEPPTFRLTAERASRLRHGGMLQSISKIKSESADHLNLESESENWTNTKMIEPRWLRVGDGKDSALLFSALEDPLR